MEWGVMGLPLGLPRHVSRLRAVPTVLLSLWGEDDFLSTRFIVQRLSTHDQRMLIRDGDGGFLHDKKNHKKYLDNKTKIENQGSTLPMSLYFREHTPPN
jgi:hypothetical protein